MEKSPKIQNCHNSERWKEHLDLARKHFKTADHMAYVTFTLLKENRLMIKILVELSETVSNLIKAFLYYEYHFKRIVLYKDPQRNLKTFVEKVALKYLNREDLKSLILILEINKKHKLAPMEFVKKDKFVILLGESYETLTIDKIKSFLSTVRKVLSVFPENE